jgi:hypothetical protein
MAPRTSMALDDVCVSTCVVRERAAFTRASAGSYTSEPADITEKKRKKGLLRYFVVAGPRMSGPKSSSWSFGPARRRRPSYR